MSSSIAPRDEAILIITHYLKALTLATGKRWTATNDADMRRLSMLMAQIADEAPADTIPACPAASATRTHDPAADDPAFLEWKRRRNSDAGAVQRMLRNGSEHQ